MKNPYLSTILKKRRAELGLTLKKVAESVGVSEATVQRWESGNLNIRYDRVVSLANTLHVDPPELFGWDVSGSSLYEVQMDLSAEEYMMVEAFRELSEDGKNYVRKSLEMASKLEAKP